MAAVLSGAALSAAVLGGCDGGVTEPPFLPETSPTPSPTPTAEATVTRPRSIGSYDDRFDFRAFAARLDGAIATADTQFFLDNVTFQELSCDDEFLAPCSCPPRSPQEMKQGIRTGASVLGIVVGIWQSEGFGLDAAGYEQFIREFLTNLGRGASDAYGDAEPKLYAYAVFRPEFQRPSSDLDTVHTIATRIAGPHSDTSLIPGPPLERGVLLIRAGFDGQRWSITGMTIGPLSFLDPVDGVLQFWERWEGTS